MSGELDLPGIEGRIVENGVAANVTREGGVTRVHLSFVPGHEPQPDASRMTVIDLPGGLEFKSGETVTVTWEGRIATFPND